MSALRSLANLGQSGTIVFLDHDETQQWQIIDSAYGHDVKYRHDSMGEFLNWAYNTGIISYEPQWSPVKMCWTINGLRVLRCDGMRLHVSQ